MKVYGMNILEFIESLMADGIDEESAYDIANAEWRAAEYADRYTEQADDRTSRFQ